MRVCDICSSTNTGPQESHASFLTPVGTFIARDLVRGNLFAASHVYLSTKKIREVK